jgi:hypothetical protein
MLHVKNTITKQSNEKRVVIYEEKATKTIVLKYSEDSINNHPEIDHYISYSSNDGGAD